MSVRSCFMSKRRGFPKTQATKGSKNGHHCSLSTFHFQLSIFSTFMLTDSNGGHQSVASTSIPLITLATSVYTLPNDDNHNDCGHCISSLRHICALRLRHCRSRYKQCRKILYQRIAFIFAPTAGNNIGKEIYGAFEYVDGTCLPTYLSHSGARIMVNYVLLRIRRD